MAIADEIRELAGLAAQTGNDELQRELLRLAERGAELEELLKGKDSQIGNLRRALELERTARGPRVDGVLARRCPDWREMLHRIAGWWHPA
jgi:hypothetical protein